MYIIPIHKLILHVTIYGQLLNACWMDHFYPHPYIHLRTLYLNHFTLTFCEAFIDQMVTCNKCHGLSSDDHGRYCIGYRLLLGLHIKGPVELCIGLLCECVHGVFMVPFLLGLSTSFRDRESLLCFVLFLQISLNYFERHLS